MQSAYGNNIIITESSKNLRALGRNALANNWKVAMVSVLVYTLIVEVVPAILNELFGMKLSEVYTNAYGYYGMDANMYSSIYGSVPDYSPLSAIYLILVSGPLNLGLALFFLAMFRRQIVEVSDIFLGFEKFGKAIGLLVYQGIFIFLWSLLFIIPGIIAALRYSQAFYILADDPEKGIKQCMDESKFLMKGNKTKYFLLSLSFIGWAFLASLISGLITGFTGMLGIEGILEIIITIIAGLFMIPVTVYMQSTFAGFYEILAGHLIKSTDPAPISPEEVAAVTAKPVEEVKKIMPEPVATAAEAPIEKVLEETKNDLENKEDGQ